MSQEFKRVTRADLDEELRQVLDERLREVLAERQPGHCMKVTDLDAEVMEAVARSVRGAAGAAAQVHVLSSEARSDDPLFITSSKLVELRNPSAAGEQRPPLLVFVPNHLRTAAEDSFADATFEHVSVTDTYQRLRARMLEALPERLRHAVPEVLRLVEERDWRWADALAGVRFLLSLRLNGYDGDVVGASLCELGLVPDFHLLDHPDDMPNRLALNLQCMDRLTFSTKSERGRVLDLKLKDSAFRNTLGSFLCEAGLEDPLRWTGRIVAEKALWPLSFDKWVFEDGAGFSQQLRVEVVELGLPEIRGDEADPRLNPLQSGQAYLVIGRGGQSSFKVKFRSDPAPERVAGVDHFRLQVIARDGGPTGFTKKKKAWTGSRRDASVSFTGLGKMDWEDGWHFVRVLACTAAGDPLPLVDAGGQAIPLAGGDDDGQLPNESELFYVVKGDDLEVELPQRAIPRFASFSHALVHFWFKAVAEDRAVADVACSHRSWADEAAQTARTDFLELRFAGEGLVHVPVSRVLKTLEMAMLSAAGDTLSWRLTLAPAETAEIAAVACEWPAVPDIESFRKQRQELFAALRGEDGLGVVQAVDLFPLRDQVAQYAERYLSLLAQSLHQAEAAPPDGQQRAIQDLQKLLALDSVSVELKDPRGAQRTALLLGPTQPLRLLWLTTWLNLAWHWMEQAKTAPREFLIPTRDSLFERLSLANFPAVFPLGSGRLLTAVDNVHALWSVYDTPTDSDPRGLIAEICTALGLPEPNVGSFALNGAFLGDRLRRYLLQHPYIHTLVLNCFNAGRGKLIADTLLELQKHPEFRDLRYNLRLFVPDPDLPGIGDDLNELISPSSSLTAIEADAFAMPTGNHLAPKITFSVRSRSDFQNSAADFPAHISVLLDAFPAQTISAMPPRPQDESAAIHGLFQDYAVTYVEEVEMVAWHRRPRHGLAAPIPDAAEFSTLLTRLAEISSSAASAVATNQAGMALRPVSTLVLEAEHRALLHQIHEVSDWVFTIDKSLGIEFFDHDRRCRRPEYLIDHSPDLAANSGRRVVITSRSQTEIRALFERVLEDYGLARYQDRAQALLTELRALSGRLALKLISSTTQRAEALGLALAKLFLEFQDAFRDQAVVPLDAHLNLYRALQKNADAFDDEISLRRTDLGLFDFDVASRLLTCNLVEVKCYRAAGSLDGLSQMKASIAAQIQQSERTLRHHFDPQHSGTADRPDRVVKIQELVHLLEFYVDRACRLRVLSPEAFEEAKFFLRSMEAGYQLRFTRSALVFDFDKEGSEEFVEENGIEYHRIGADLIATLLAALPATCAEDETRPVPSPCTAVTGEPPPDALVRLQGQVPKLGRAAFLPERRERTVSWGSLATTLERAASDDEALEPRKPVAPQQPRLAAATHVAPLGAIEPHAAPGLELAAQVRQEKVVTPASPEVANAPASLSVQQASCLSPDILLGVSEGSPQFGILGKVMGRTVALDLNQTHTISLFGVQGGGKSYTLGSIIEMASLPLPGINVLPQPLATVLFHYSQTQDYKPEFTSMNRPNGDARSIELLAAEYGARPGALKDIVLLVPEAKLEARCAEYPDIRVIPLKFASRELQASHWRFLMGAVGNQATYIRKLNQIMRGIRDDLTVARLREAVEHAGFPENLRDLASLRLDLASEFIDDAARLSEIVRPGRLVIVDLRDEFIEKEQALGLFVVLLQIFADATVAGKPFNKLVVFDEAHKYIDDGDLVAGLVSVVREMRHKGTSVLVASQDPPSVPVALIELSTQIILHRFNSPKWLNHLQKANAALLSLDVRQLARLEPGQAFVWSSKSTTPSFSQAAVKCLCRPRATRHGGETRTAV